MVSNVHETRFHCETFYPLILLVLKDTFTHRNMTLFPLHVCVQSKTPGAATVVIGVPTKIIDIFQYLLWEESRVGVEMWVWELRVPSLAWMATGGRADGARVVTAQSTPALAGYWQGNIESTPLYRIHLVLYLMALL